MSDICFLTLTTKSMSTANVVKRSHINNSEVVLPSLTGALCYILTWINAGYQGSTYHTLSYFSNLVTTTLHNTVQNMFPLSVFV